VIRYPHALEAPQLPDFVKLLIDLLNNFAIIWLRRGE